MDAKGSWQSAAAGTAMALGLLVAFSAPAGTAQGVTIQTFQFKPTSIEVPAGSRVSFTNEDDITHTITSGAPENPDGKSSHRLEGKGATAAHRPVSTRTSASGTGRCAARSASSNPFTRRREP